MRTAISLLVCVVGWAPSAHAAPTSTVSIVPAVAACVGQSGVARVHQTAYIVPPSGPSFTWACGIDGALAPAHDVAAASAFVDVPIVPARDPIWVRLCARSLVTAQRVCGPPTTSSTSGYQELVAFPPTLQPEDEYMLTLEVGVPSSATTYGYFFGIAAEA